MDIEKVVLTEAHSSIALQCGVGIELELEGSDHIEADMWDCTEDGSLRNGCEMVCSRPYNGQELLDAINNLSEAVAESHAEGTWRCSTHVHMDMRDADSNILKKTFSLGPSTKRCCSSAQATIVTVAISALRLQWYKHR